MTTPTPIITTPKFHLRHYIKADAEPMVLVLNDRSIAKNMRSRLPSPYALSDAMYWITLCENDTSEPRLKSFGIFMPDGELAGSIGLEDPKGDPIYAGTRELGYLMSSKFRGQGIMTAVVQEFTQWAFATVPDLLRIEACVFEYNEASKHVLSKAGFVKEGTRRMCAVKDGKLISEDIFGLTRADLEKL